MNDPAIVSRGLTRRFGKLLAVDDVDMTIPSGSIYGFLGPNGSGKTTTIHMLCGLLRPTDGSCEVLGMKLPREAEKVRPRIGYMTQRFSLYEDLSVRENLNFMARIYSMRRRRRQQRVDTNLVKYMLDDRPGQRAGTLSGGQKQRLALAAVTLHEPELLLLDEPTSAVDPQSRRDFWDGLFELAETGTTILVSTHFMDEAERCHRLAILADGRLVAEGMPRHLSAEVDAVVLEIDTDHPRPARAALRELPYVLAVTQLGQRLHVMVECSAEAPEQQVQSTLAAAAIACRVERITANLEDVFVASTGFGRKMP